MLLIGSPAYAMHVPHPALPSLAISLLPPLPRYLTSLPAGPPNHPYVAWMDALLTRVPALLDLIAAAAAGGACFATDARPPSAAARRQPLAWLTAGSGLTRASPFRPRLTLPLSPKLLKFGLQTRQAEHFRTVASWGMRSA